MTEAERRAYVEARLTWVICGMRYDGQEWMLIGSLIPMSIAIFRPTEAEAWAAAYDFTVAHEAKIAEVRQEIAYLGNPTLCLTASGYETDFAAIRERLLAKAEAELQGLLEGFREGKG